MNPILSSSTTEVSADDVEVLRCRSSADFLAALPRITGFTATNSLFAVLFVGKRAENAVRVDLPPTDSPADSIGVIDFLCEIVHDFSAACGAPVKTGLVITSAKSFADAGGTPWRRLAKRIERRLRRERIELLDFCCVAPDGWCCYFDSDGTPRPLAEIESSPVAADAPPDLSELATLPHPDCERQAQVSEWIDGLREAQAAKGTPTPDDTSWVTATATVTRALLMADTRLSPHMTARLILSAQHPARWFVMALGLLIYPEYPEEVARETGAETFNAISVGLDADHEPQSSMLAMLAILCPDYCDRERLRGLRERLHIALSETPDELRPGLLAFAAWVWWLAGHQTVALRHLDSALEIDPENELAQMVTCLATGSAKLRPLYPPNLQ